MTFIDIPKLTNRTIGFDSLFNELSSMDYSAPAYPPHNIVKDKDGKYVVTVAVAGFPKDSLKVVVKDSIATISGEKEKVDQTVSIRRRHVGDLGSKPIDAIVGSLLEEIKTRRRN